MPRLFVAISLSDEFKRSLLKQTQPLHGLAPSARWTPIENWHITVEFLGEWSPQKVPALQEALADICSRHPPFELPMDCAGTFGAPRTPSVLWLGSAQKILALESLRDELLEAFVSLHHQPSGREFHPHLTLARSKYHRGDDALARCAERLSAKNWGIIPVKALTLYQSELKPGQAVHVSLGEYPLKNPKD